MPFRDATGPRGAGPLTGRAAGFCPGAARFGAFGRRGGWGYRHWFHATGLPTWARRAEAPTEPVSQEEALREQLTWLESQVERVKGALAETPKSG